MKERPIIFSGEMVKAILDGRKTQTRRVIKLNHPGEWELAEVFMDKTDFAKPHARFTYAFPTACAGNNWQTRPSKWITSRYGRPGDILYVRETWRPLLVSGDDLLIEYRADGAEWSMTMPQEFKIDITDRWRPSIYMPKWASRIKLEVTAVRVERLQEISESDARNEGANRVVFDDKGIAWLADEIGRDGTFKDGFKCLWDSINAKRDYAWDSNPWVWVVEFERVQP